MKTIMHPDNWAEIPAGEYITGLPLEQENFVRERIYQWAGYDALSPGDKQHLDNVVTRRREHAVASLSMGYFESVRSTPQWSSEERKVIESNQRLSHLIGFEGRLAQMPFLSSTKANVKKRFYMMRFPVNGAQMISLPAKKGAIVEAEFPGTLDGPADISREVRAIDEKYARRFCRHLGGRLPTWEEWEKAGRGTDGRLYPWGNEWDLEAGDFYYGQPTLETRRVDAYPRGMSPYGVWAMAGGIPELVKKGPPMGTHARETSAEMAWLSHMFPFTYGGRWGVSFRPVLNKWPDRQLTGFQAGLTIPNAEALQKMGPLADTLLTQYRWNDLAPKTLDILEPAIVAVREARWAEAQELLAEILHNEATLEAAWLLQATTPADISKQRECVQQALTLNPDSEAGLKLGKLLEEPARVSW